MNQFPTQKYKRNFTNEILFLICMLLWPITLWSHAHTHTHAPSQSSENLLLTEELFNQAVMLAPEVLSASEKGSTNTAYFKVWGYHIPLNNGFRNLMRGWMRLYQQKIEAYCACDIPEETLLKHATASIAEGFFATKIGNPTSHAGEHIAMSLYSYSARYGKVAALLKASAEVVEHSLAFFSLGKGVHIFCNVIDVMIFFILRKTQTFTRVFSGSNNAMNKNKGSSLLMAFRSAFLSMLIKRAQKQVFFHLETTDINPITLAKVDQEGIKKHKRAAWVSRLSQKITPLIAQIQQIDSSLEQEGLLDQQKIKLLKKRRKLYRKMENITQVSQKNFFGKRYKRFGFLLSRKSTGTYLKGDSFLDTLISKPGFWPSAIQENILQNAFISAGKEGNFPNPVNQNQTGVGQTLPLEQGVTSEAFSSYREDVRLGISNKISLALKSDGVRSGLAQEFVEKINQIGLEKGAISEVLSPHNQDVRQESMSSTLSRQNPLTESTNAYQTTHIHYVERKLMDIDNIFNPNLPIKERYFMANELELELTGFFEYHLKLIYQKIIQQQSFSIKERFKLRWKLEKFAYYAFAFADFLRMASMVKDKSHLFLFKHKAMENYLIFYEYLSSVSHMASSSVTKQNIDTTLEKNLQKIISFQIQREKRTAFSWWGWLPFHTPLPYCRNLVRTT